MYYHTIWRKNYGEEHPEKRIHNRCCMHVLVDNMSPDC